jgi:hypothetical protein
VRAAPTFLPRDYHITASDKISKPSSSIDATLDQQS